MKIVIDSNILFSALIKDSLTRKIIAYYNGQFLIPSFVFDEMVNHKDELYQKSRLNKEEFEEVLLLLLKKIKLIPTEQISQKLAEARQILQNIDPKDEVFIACALAYPGSILWSEDKKLKDQNEIRILKTSEIALFLS